jgi:CheY-like chemotaxis protein
MNIAGIAGEVVANLKTISENKNLKLFFESKYQIVNCLIDEKMLADICYNLIQNAITYTNKGEIRVKIDTLSKNGKEYASLSVKDTGIGIAQKFHKQIFEPFRQASEGLSRKFEGTGLGLTLTKKYVDMLDGNITLISEEGCGAEFVVTLPLIEAVIQPVFINQENENSKRENKLTSLFVEDEIESFEFVRMLLRPYMDVENITSGKVAMEQVKNKQYNMIFMDIGLSGINGMDVTRFIRKLENYKYIPIIAVTAFAMEGDKERSLESGCNEYISKPFTKEDLFSAVGKYINIKKL